MKNKPIDSLDQCDYVYDEGTSHARRCTNLGQFGEDLLCLCPIHRSLLSDNKKQMITSDRIEVRRERQPRFNNFPTDKEVNYIKPNKAKKHKPKKSPYTAKDLGDDILTSLEQELTDADNKGRGIKQVGQTPSWLLPPTGYTLDSGKHDRPWNQAQLENKRKKGGSHKKIK